MWFNSFDCFDCPTGYFQADANRGTCIECPSGKFQVNAAAPQCDNYVVCPPGSHVVDPDNMGDGRCAQCAPMHYSVESEESECKSCPQGKFANDAGAIVCDEVREAAQYVRRVKRKAAKAKLSFPITADEAKDPATQDALMASVANSLGLSAANIKIVTIGGVKVGRQRMLTSNSVDIEFQIMPDTDDASAADQLQMDLTSAAAGGTIVANVQGQAYKAYESIAKETIARYGKAWHSKA